MLKGHNKQLYLITVILVAVVVLANWYAQQRIEQSIRLNTSKLLQSVLNPTQQALKVWSRQERASAEVWANNPTVREHTQTLLGTPRNRKDLNDARAQGQLRDLLKPVVESREYKGFFIIAPDGTSLASLRRQNIGTPNLIKQQPEILQQLLEGRSVLSLPQVSDVPLPDPVSGHLVVGLPTLFVGAPVFDSSGKVIAGFLFRIDPHKDFDNIFQRGQIGKTGETYAINREGLMLSNSRFTAELISLGLLEPGEDAMLNIELRDPGDKLSQNGPFKIDQSGWPLNRVAQAAMRSETGEALDGYKDYRGNRVVGAWHWDESLNLGIVTELDKSEAYAPLDFTRTVLNSLSSVAILLILFLAVYLVASQRKERENRERVTGLVDLSDDAIISINPDHNIILANPAAHTMFGYAPGELLEANLESLIPGNFREAHRAHVETFKATGEEMVPRDMRGKVEGLRKDGTTFIMEATLYKQTIDGEVVMTVTAHDITERERVLNHLRNNEQMFREIFEASEDAIFLLDNDGVIDCNTAAIHMFGASDKEALLGLHPRNFSPEFQPDGQSSTAKSLAMIEQAREQYFNRFEWVHRRLTGEHFPAEVTLTLTQYDNKPIVYGAVRDITEVKLAEEALRDSETLMRKTIEQSPVAKVLSDNSGNVQLLNRKFVETFGWTPEDIPTQEAWWLAAYPDPEYRRRVQQRWDIAVREAQAENREISPQFWSVTCKDGSVREVEFRMMPISSNLQIIALNDLTERKAAEVALQESEARLRMLAEYANDMISLHDASGVYRYASPACERLLGYREEELLGHSAYEFFHTEDLDLIEQSHGTILELNTPIVVTYRIRHKDGHYVWVETVSNTVIDPQSDDAIEIVAVTRDVTERVESEQQQEQIRRQIMQAQKMEALGRLSGGIAHDFNNILASAKGYTELALMQAEEAGDEKLQQYLGEVFKSAERAAAVVRQMLTYSRSDKSTPSPQLLQDVVEDNLIMLKPMLGSRIELTTHLDAGALPVAIDSMQMEQVLLNLCLNARDAIDNEGTIEIGVRSSRMQGECSSCHSVADYDAVELYVTDDGMGLDIETRTHMFDPFYTRKEVGQGLGMGLAVVHGIVHEHNGHI
ncbi:MAG: PAS domain S-box protein, partial [Gammaproteobacteria bacterium]|nr:PAS domain S-box protein [Gammaproteobacteria bacterium]